LIHPRTGFVSRFVILPGGSDRIELMTGLKGGFPTPPQETAFDAYTFLHGWRA
jgi:hypothetical protein